MHSGLIVSCQALPDEPLHSSFIMGRMALAAKIGGAVGIRANGVADILEIQKNVTLPIIGIIKKNYPNIKAYITPTMSEVEELIKLDIDVIALDSTINQDEGFLKKVIRTFPNQAFMADISTIEEGIKADNLGFSYVSTTLVGYTESSLKLDKIVVLEELISRCKAKIVAEGNFDSPELANKAMQLGAYAVVVGGAITRPQLITKKFTEAIKLNS